MKGTTLLNKHEIFKLLNEKGLIPNEKPMKPVNPTTKGIKPNHIGNMPNKVIITDLQTGIETEYPSTYRAGKTLGCAARVITYFNGKQEIL